MTKSASKHGLRAAAEAKRKKHAQRTPLPPRPGEVEAAKEAVAEATLPSVLKATDFAQAAKAAGWEAESWWEGDHSKVLAKRGNESIQIEWVKGVFVPETCNYRHGESNATKLRNASAAKARMAVAPAEAAAQAARRAEGPSRGAVGPRVSKARISRHRTVQFATALDEEVLEAVRGHKIFWVNRITGLEEEDFVRDVTTVRQRGPEGGTPVKVSVASLAAPRITEDKSGRTLRFLGAFGFRCVLVDAIERVGR
jgi:hypothetical protein